MKLNILYFECVRCGSHIYPPKDVSDVGVEAFEEVYDAPPLKPRPEWVPTPEQLRDINKSRRESGLPEFKDINDWVVEYRNWAIKFREDVKARVGSRVKELNGKLLDIEVVELEDKIVIKGRRYLAVYEEIPNGYRLKCPVCGSILIEVTRGG